MTAWEDFIDANYEIKCFAVNSQKNYECLLGDQLKSSPRLFHSYIKQRKVNRPSIGPLRLPNGNMTDNPSIMANYLVNSFASVFNLGHYISAYQNQICENDISCLVFLPNMVEEMLLSLDANSCMGGDGIHPRLLKSLAKRLSVPLCIIFNNSLNSGQLPNSWKKSIVVPIYKKGSRLDTLNYRPVSLTLVSCKTMERLIVSHLMTYVNNNSILSKDQFGIRKLYSTADQLLITYKL